MNKKLILIVVLAICFSILVGCSATLPEGIENKEFYKDLKEAQALIEKGFSEQKYYKKDIDTIFNRMNGDNYKNGLNAYELLILETLNDNISDIEIELTTGKHMISSITLDNIEWILDIGY